MYNSTIKNEEGGASYRLLRNSDRADIGTTSRRRHWADVSLTHCRRRWADEVWLSGSLSRYRIWVAAVLIAEFVRAAFFHHSCSMYMLMS